MKESELPTPCYLVDESALERNLKILRGVSERTGCKILLAQKAFSMFSEYKLVGKYLDGTCASGLFEARLGSSEMGKECHVFSAAYRGDDVDELSKICSHIVFNSMSQLSRFGDNAAKFGAKIGLRINPEFSTQKNTIYDPCAAGSRLGIVRAQLPDVLPPLVSGLHFHTLCEQNSDALEKTLRAVESKFGAQLRQIKWINFGGGHHITKPDYEIETLENCILRMRRKYGLEVYLEPGEAVALDAGELVCTVLDIVHNGIETAIVDASAACHMPDVIEMPYRPPLRGSGRAGEKTCTYRISGATCLAGDTIGDYSFDAPLEIGSRLKFSDMAIYSFVKNNTFNGMPLPTLAVKDADGNCRIVKEFGYEDFRGRLG